MSDFKWKLLLLYCTDCRPSRDFLFSVCVVAFVRLDEGLSALWQAHKSKEIKPLKWTFRKSSWLVSFIAVVGRGVHCAAGFYLCAAAFCSQQAAQPTCQSSQLTAPLYSWHSVWLFLRLSACFPLPTTLWTTNLPTSLKTGCRCAEERGLTYSSVFIFLSLYWTFQS